MASAQSDVHSPDRIPSTPQPRHAALPTDSYDHVAKASSRLMARSTSPIQAIGVQSSNGLERNKPTSPPPPSSSMTPPPSSQQPKRQSSSSPTLRVITPTLSLLSSPPATLTYDVKRENGTRSLDPIQSSKQMIDASPSELRNMLQTSLSENNRLDVQLREARMSAAHHKLQHNLLSIETEEAAKRMEVEHEMTRREVEVLQMAEQARLARNHEESMPQSYSSRYVTELKAYCEALAEDNVESEHRLQSAKRILAEKEDEVMLLLEENRGLVRRIRENREHLNRLKSPGGIYAAATPRPSTSGYPSTPQQYTRGTPIQTPHSLHHDNENGQDSFAALLLADRVLNQENPSDPSTPQMAVQSSDRSRLRHHRAVQSMSSLPTTPIRSLPTADGGNLLPSVQFAPQSEPRHHHQRAFQDDSDQHRRRKSRDSTISVSDDEDNGVPYQSGNEEIHESQASQSASAMLRRDPRESFEVLGSPSVSSTAEKTGLVQTKLYGNVTKAGVGKRKASGVITDHDVKKTRTRLPAVGLGIGGWE